MSSASTTPPGVGATPGALGGDLEAQVDARMLRIGYAQLRLALTMTLVVVAVFIGLLWPYFPRALNSTWSLALVSVATLRFAGLHAFMRQDEAGRCRARWRWAYVLGAAAAGASWSYGPVMIIADAGHAESYLLALTMLAVGAVSMSSLSAQLHAMWAFQIVTLLPTAVALWVTGGEVERLAGLIVLAGMLSLMAVGRVTNVTLRSRIGAEIRLAAALREADTARAGAESASLAKSRFLANMSHELRTPLNAVIGAAQLMKIDGRDAGQREHLVDAIQRSGTNLLGLIANILDLSRIEAGQMKLLQDDFHLVECIDAVLATAGLAARAKGLRLACIVDPSLAAWRCGDEARLRQLLLNLLGNAVKFTSVGEVVLRVTPLAARDGVCIGITDTGPGIEASALAHVFEPFRQADEAADRRFGGSGLGLAIVRQVAQAMGGEVSVHSQLGRGTTFTLALPLPETAAPPAEPPPLALRVACIEPHEASAQALLALLQRLGCQARRCTTVDELRGWAVETNAADDAWLLVDTEAAQTQHWLEQAAEWLDPQHVVGLASAEGYDSEQVREQCKLPRQLIRPVTRAALASRLVRRPSAASRPMPLELLTEVQWQALTHVLVVEDDPLNQTIVCRLLEHAGYRVSTADDGRSALDALRERAVDLVLMDWQMPDMDGIEVTRRVRAGEAGEAARALPIVALTANAFAEDREACLAAGMSDFLTKPVNATRLTQAVERWSRHAGGEAKRRPDGAVAAPVATAAGRVAAETLAHATAAMASPPPPVVFDPRVLAALPMVADGSDAGYGQQVLAMFIGATPGTLASIRAAAERGDAQALQRLLHTLKSASGAVGAMALAGLAAQAEQGLLAGAGVASGLAAQFQHAFDALLAHVPRPTVEDRTREARI